MALLEKQLEVRDSNIPEAGLGLFTTEAIPKGAKIVEYKGRIKTWKEVKNNDTNLYIFYVNQKHVIDGSRSKKSLARYINDADGLKKIKGFQNNSQFVREGLRVFVEATHDIAAGEEIFVAYGNEYWDVIRTNEAV